MVKPNTAQPLVIQLSNGQVVTSDDVLTEFGQFAFDYQTGRWKIPIPQLKRHFEEKTKKQRQQAKGKHQLLHSQGLAQHQHHLLSAFGQRHALPPPIQTAPNPLLQHFKRSQQNAVAIQRTPKPAPQHPLLSKFKQAQQQKPVEPKGLLSKLAGLFRKK